MRRHLLTLLLMGWLVLLVTPAGVRALEAPLGDPVLEARAQSLAREIRCVVCENEPVALSSAEIAVDMRKAIRERIAAGDSDAQVRRFFAERYGEFVLLRPRIGIDTFALWGAPLALLFLGGLGLYVASRRGQAAPIEGSSIDDTQALAALKEFENKAPTD
jgi:cytochrome c-type biogenesis protein CcmH